MTKGNPKKPTDVASYNRGYKAGLKRGKATPERMSDEQFYDEAFLQLLPTAMTVQGWTIDNKPVHTTAARMQLCHLWASQAVAKRRCGP